MQIPRHYASSLLRGEGREYKVRKPRLPRRRLSLVQGEFEQAFLSSDCGGPFVIGGGLGICDLRQNLPAGSKARALE